MKHLSLNGLWQLRWSDGARGGSVDRLLVDQPELHRVLVGQVPGSVHQDLMQAGLLAEPATGLNVLRARWVEENRWFYRRVFSAPELAAGEQAFLTFDCLDLVSVIYLNGNEIGRHANAFYPCRINVTGALKTGENVLVVALESGLFSTAEKPYSGYGLAYDGPLHKRQWLRQTQSTFEWDWSPRLLNVGIRGEVSLDIYRGFRLETFVPLAEVSQDLQLGRLKTRLVVEGLNAQPFQAQVRVHLAPPEGGDAITLSSTFTIRPGIQTLQLEVEVPSPQLWWPVGHGSQPLYAATATLMANDEEVCISRKLGFRRVEVNQAPHAQGGRYFIITVNHKPIFCKGGNLIPGDILMARLDRKRYQMLVDRALEANFNLLRVWGGGLYESSEFYELCDAAGLLVWQEFIFACAKYPVHDEGFLADVEREAIFQVRRLAHHPSLVVWCGNNELEWGAWDWGYHKGVAHPDYALFHLVLPRILSQEDGTRYYQPSSPFSPDLQSPNQENTGDQHPWSVGFGNTDFRDYRAMACRFPNEGGFLGPTALPTLKACLEGDANPFHTHAGATTSFAFEIHDNSIAHSENHTQADRSLHQWLDLNITEMTLEDYAYFGGLLQGMALAEYIRNFRRRMFDSASAIFWMYNDCWPATRSWTIVDYYGRRTPSFYPVRRAFQPLTVAIAVEANSVQVFGINEGPTWHGSLHSGLVSLSGGYPLEFTREAILPGNAATLLASFSLTEWQRLGVSQHAAFSILRDENGREVSRDTYLLPFFKEMAWPQAKVQVEVKEGKAIFTSATFAWRVCLDLDGERPLPDNFFDILPGIPTILPWADELGEPKLLRLGNLVRD